MPANVNAGSPLYGLDHKAAYADHCFGLNSDIFEVLKDNSSGGVAVADAVGGELTISSGGTSAADNDGVYYATKGEVVSFANGFNIKSHFKFSEANTDDANAVAIGCMSGAAVGTILTANGGGPTASVWSAMIYKVDGETVWRCASCAGGTVTSDITEITAESTDLNDFEIEVIRDNDGYALIVFKMNGEVLKKANSNAREPITHEIAISGASEMNVFVGGQTGAATEETFTLGAIGFATAI